MLKNLFILRHGPAGERADFALTGQADSLRPLTLSGKKEVKAVTEFLLPLLPKIDLLLASPYVRTQQTAAIVRKILRPAKVSTSLMLRPHAGVDDTWGALKSLPECENVMIVGHQPHLGRLINFLLTSDVAEPFHIKKTGFAWFEVDGSGRSKTKVTLKCFLQPSHIKKIRSRRKK